MSLTITFVFYSSKPKRKRETDSGAPADTASAPAPDNNDELLKEYVGTGRITSSGITVHGHFTEFSSQLVPGDAIIITHPVT